MGGVGLSRISLPISSSVAMPVVSKGCTPTSIMNSITPTAYISAASVTGWPLRNLSGLQYAFVPNDRIAVAAEFPRRRRPDDPRPPRSSTIAHPKSMIFTVSAPLFSEHRRMFSGLRSACVTPMLCRKAKADSISVTRRDASNSLYCPLRIR
jgi:hypothetical protein